MNTNLGTILQFTLFLNIQRQYVDSLSYYPDPYTSKMIRYPSAPYILENHTGTVPFFASVY